MTSRFPTGSFAPAKARFSGSFWAFPTRRSSTMRLKPDWQKITPVTAYLASNFITSTELQQLSGFVLGLKAGKSRPPGAPCHCSPTTCCTARASSIDPGFLLPWRLGQDRGGLRVARRRLCQEQAEGGLCP